MKMSKFVRRMIFLFCVVILGATSFGFSYFFFENERTQSNTTDSFKLDNIKENYSFNGDSTSSDKTYTIYFFPSAAYMHLEYLYLEEGAVAPELQFGYKEVQYNESGNVLVDDNGKARYKLSDVGQYSETNYDNTQITYDGAFRKYIGTKFSNDYFEADGTGDDRGPAYGSNGAFMTTYNALTEKRTWGEPGEDFTIYSGTDGREEKYNGHNQYSLDRLGCWDESYYYGKTVKDSDGDGAITGDINVNNSALNDTNTGRYLPIKITVSNTLSMDAYEAAMQDVFTSMGNSEDWHNYTFTEWTYVTKDSDGTYDYPYSHLDNTETASSSSDNVGEAFQPKEIDRYFDIFSNLGKYADDNGVIRLFPMFSNGKKTTASDRTLYNGGGATQKLEINYGDKTVYKYPLFTSDVYNDGTGNFTYGDDSTEVDLLKSEYIRLFSYNNIKITSSSNITSMKFSANNVWNYTKEESIGNWNSDETHWDKCFWGSLYHIESTDGYENNLNNLIAEYGEGLYTFYIFVANYSYQNGPGSGTSNSEDSLKATFDAFYENVVTQAMNGAFSSLKNKNLVRLSYVSSDYHDGYRCSPTVIAFEKVEEPKIIRDFPISNDSVDGISTINNYISSKYSLAPSFYKNNEYMYSGKETDGSYYAENTTDLSSDRPYTYVVKNVNFMDLQNSSLYFLIAFGGSYTTYNTFTNNFTYEQLITSGTEITDTTNPVSSDSTIVYKKSSEYVESKDVKDSSDSSKTYQFVKFKDDSYLGVYDVLITRKSGSDVVAADDTSSSPFEVYMHRHTNKFCKVFTDKPENGTDGYVDHYTSDGTNQTSNGATLLFNKQYFIGEWLKPSDKSSMTSNNGTTLENCLTTYITDTLQETDLTKYKLIDWVTGSAVAYYVQNTDGTYSLKCDLKIYKNYVFYLQKSS